MCGNTETIHFRCEKEVLLIRNCEAVEVHLQCIVVVLCSHMKLISLDKLHVLVRYSLKNEKGLGYLMATIEGCINHALQTMKSQIRLL